MTTDTSTASAPTPATAAAITPDPIADGSVGTAQCRIVTGTKRVQVLAAGHWYDLEGVAMADVFTSDPRYAARITLSRISTISQEAAGAAPKGIDGKPAKQAGTSTSSPVRTFSAPAEGQVSTGNTAPALAAAVAASAKPATPAATPAATETP